MRKSLVSLAVVSAISLSFVGCGSSDSAPSAQSAAAAAVIDATAAAIATDVTVERGPVYGAIVKDAAGNVAQQKVGENVYTFAQTPVYPITATGGWIDVDNDGVMSENDIALNIEMKSYSNVVTPVTTYIADANPTKRDEKLQALLAKVNSGSTDLITAEDLLKVASEAPQKAQMTINAVYAEMVQSGSADINTDDVLGRINDFQNLNLDPSSSAKIRAGEYENYLLNNSDLAELLNYSRLNRDEILANTMPVFDSSSIVKESKIITILRNIPLLSLTWIQSQIELSASANGGVTIYRASKENITCAADFVGFGHCIENDLYSSNLYDIGETVTIIGVENNPGYVADTSTAGINDIVGKTFYTFTNFGEHSYYEKISYTSLVPPVGNSEHYSLANGQWVLRNYEKEEDNSSVSVSSIEGDKFKNVATQTDDSGTHTNTSYISIAEKTSTYWTIKHEFSSTEGSSSVVYVKYYLSPTPEILDPSLLLQTSPTARSVAKNNNKTKIFGLLMK